MPEVVSSPFATRLLATVSPEDRGLARDSVRMLVSDKDRLLHRRFSDIGNLLKPGDILVVNQSATVAASLAARSSVGSIRLNLSGHLGGGVWLAEPRWSSARPGPLPITQGEWVLVGEHRVQLLRQYPGQERIWFVRSDSDLNQVMEEHGAPIRYGYLQGRYGVEHYQTLFSRVPGSSEMPSASRPFTPRVVGDLLRLDVQILPLTLHTGVSSLEVDTWGPGSVPVLPEWFQIPPETALAIETARRDRRRIIAVGTTVVRALESSLLQDRIVPMRGFTTRFISPASPPRVVSGLLTGLHETSTTHLQMINSITGSRRLERAYVEAQQLGYLWHELGDVHLILN